MSTIYFRPDYAKFLIQCPDELWNHYYNALNIASHERKYSVEWLKSHKVNRLSYNADNGMSLWSVDIWGEWAGVVEALPADWFQFLKRYDIRATIWDASDEQIISIGQHLQRTITSYNVNVYSTRPATKRMGRDRGGKGFAIGSHKSDLRVSIYRRNGEPTAQEFQCTGALLSRLVEKIHADITPNWEVRSPWVILQQQIRIEGEKRLARLLHKAGIADHWYLIGPAELPHSPPLQKLMVFDKPTDADLAEFSAWAEEYDKAHPILPDE